MILELLILLAAARLAAEVAERLSLPAVATEIAFGIVVGPSLLGVAGDHEALQFLGELGVIVLLLQVGLELDLGELTAVGRPALVVAGIGVALPFAGGAAVGAASGLDITVAIFIGAALTATSVGITARVFGDLRRLSTVEARTVLGAAVADDVLGLLILTVVARLATSGSFSLREVAWTAAVAVGFVCVAAIAGDRVLPPVLRWADQHARAVGVAVAAGLITGLAFAELAGRAGLAPIVGAFLAGLGLGRSAAAERIRRELTPIGQFLVPLFFVQVGVAVDLRAVARGGVLTIAAGLLVAAVGGKLLAGLGAGGSGGDRLLIGLGMLPRGEVGLIFASLALASGVLDDRLYGALLLVILITTLVSPPLLRWRLRAATGQTTPTPAVEVPPDGRWLEIIDGRITLRGSPGPGQAMEVALLAARLAATHPPSPGLLDWFAALPPTFPGTWHGRVRDELFDLLRHGNARSWRLLETTGVLDWLLPELTETIRHRRADASELDPVHVFRWGTVEAAQSVDPAEYATLAHPEWLLLAALICDLSGDQPSPVDAARRLAGRLALGAAAEQELLLLISGRSLLIAAARRLDALEEQRAMPLAAHLATAERARALYLLTLAGNDLDPATRSRLDDLYELLQSLLSHPELTGRDARNLLERRRAEAQRIADRADARERLVNAPRAWLLTHPPPELARQAALIDPLPRPARFRVAVVDRRIYVVTRDRRGLLAAVANVLAREGLAIDRSVTSTWPDGGVVMSFDVDAHPADGAVLAERLDRANFVWGTAPIVGIRLTFDDDASPWHTITDVTAPDRRGLLAAVAAAFAAAGLSIHLSEATTEHGTARDRFEVTNRHGGKLSAAEKISVEQLLAAGANGAGRRRRWFAREPAIDKKHSAHALETSGP